MMRTRHEMKADAKESLRGNLGTSALVEVAGGAIRGVAKLIPFGGMLVSGPLDVATADVYCKNTDRRERPRFLDLFNGFRENFGENFLMALLKGIFLVLWSLLLVIPGLVKSYSYSMTEYLMARNKDMTAMEAISESRRLMKGNKMRLFGLNLSFIGWILLTIATFGVAGIYVLPYMSTTRTEFFNDIYYAA